MNGKMYKIVVVKDLDVLLKYGFKKEKCEYKHLGTIEYNFYSGKTDYKGRAISCITVYNGGSKPNQLCFSSQGGALMKVVCELYKDDVIKFVEYRTTDQRITRKKLQIEKLQNEIKALEEADYDRD